MRGILLTREDHIEFFTKKKPFTSIYIYCKTTKSIVVHLMTITSKVITSYLAYHGEKSI
jgi:hypothetical protein